MPSFEMDDDQWLQRAYTKSELAWIDGFDAGILDQLDGRSKYKNPFEDGTEEAEEYAKGYDEGFIGG